MQSARRTLLILAVVTATLVTPAAWAGRRTNFLPAVHGFHFVNNFENPILDIGLIRWSTQGLCGGMAMAALDYYDWSLPIPTHTGGDFGNARNVPPNGSRLADYIFARQVHTILTVNDFGGARFITAPWVTLEDQYNWSVSDEFPRIKARIDAGQPCVLGLRGRGDLLRGHQVVAYGYDENPKKVYIYDPNYPDQEMVLRADEAARRIVHEDLNGNGTGDRDRYASYFFHNVHFPDYRPPYLDLGVRAGIILRPKNPSAVRLYQPLGIEVVVHNYGDYPANVRQLFIYVRDPLGRNRDDFLGGGDEDATPIPPGGERRILRSSDQFGDVAGNWRIGVSYLSAQGYWIPIPALGSGARQEAVLYVNP